MAGLLIAAPSSGQGKTTLTLGLLRALKRSGVALAPGKAGPDYIDPAFHAAAAGSACFNYDPWAMRPELMLANASLQMAGGKLFVVEAMMGLFDAAADGRGSSGDLARLMRLPVVFVVDASKMSHSIAALVRGFAGFDAGVMIAGVILNNVASERHGAMLRDALGRAGMSVFGTLMRDPVLKLPERHLGLVQAQEHEALEGFIERAADAVSAGVDLDAVLRAAGLFRQPESEANIHRLPPPGQRIAVAQDVAFAFAYTHMLFGWRRRGAAISFFSPLADEAPPADCDVIYLPGGYPEMHAGQLAAATRFRNGMIAARDRGAAIFGECGGYMVLGDGLIDADGVEHPMLGMLSLTTSFAERRRHLGYRVLTPLAGAPATARMTAHEFHYATIVWEEGDRLFAARDALGADLGQVGLRRGRVAGSFMHLIDLAGDA